MATSELYPASRLAAVAERVRAEGLDALLLTPGADLRYVTGYDAKQLERLTCLVIPAADPAFLVVPRLELAAAQASPASGLGLELIPWYKTELIIQAPPYYNYSSDPSEKNGSGDIAFLLKYRILSGNEQHGNYILTAFLGWSIPTGTYSNGQVTGANSATITPTLAYGKGFGNFDAQGTFGVQIPTSNEPANGRNYVWNNTLQYRLVKKLSPEIEFNTTHYQDGEHAGKTLNYVTPGIVAGRFKLTKRVGMSIGGGFQIATSQFYRNNHNGIFTIRFPF